MLMRRIEWQRERDIPRGVAAMLNAMRFDGGEIRWPDPAELESAECYLHRNQLTLLSRHACGGHLPPGCRARFDRFYDANRERLVRLRAATREVIDELDRAGIETVLLKGFARAGGYVPDPQARMHYDVDLYCPHAAHQAAAVLGRIGYQALERAESDAAGHLPPLARPTSWKWRGDFFDLETPVHVELHPVLWTPEIERFSFSGLDDFWSRRERHEGNCTLSRPDTLAYRCMHLLRHLLRGDLRAAGVYEIAYFLHENFDDDEFWRMWRNLFARDLQRTQAVCFALAARWFGCRMHAIPATAVDALAEPIRSWMEHSAASPVASFFVPAKHELTLHWALVDSTPEKLRVALRRMVPVRHSARMWESRSAYLARLRSRAVFHVKALAPTLAGMLRRS